jgi:hypothetical protein
MHHPTHNIYSYKLFTIYLMCVCVFQRDGRGMGRVCGEGRDVHRVLVGKPEVIRPLGRPRRRWEDIIRVDLPEVGVGSGNWMELAQDRDRWRALVSTVKNLRVS